MTASAGTPTPQKWWTGGRITVAVIVVLLLMGGAGFAGFVAGLAVGGSQSFIDEFEQLDGFEDQGFDGEFGNEVPGTTPLDTPSTTGSDIRPGGTTEGFYDGTPVDHPLTVVDAGSVAIEVRSDDFDTVLVLLDANGDLVASDDDGTGGTDSLLRLDLEPGSYTVRVQPWSDFETGGYTLSVD